MYNDKGWSEKKEGGGWILYPARLIQRKQIQQNLGQKHAINKFSWLVMTVLHIEYDKPVVLFNHTLPPLGTRTLTH